MRMWNMLITEIILLDIGMHIVWRLITRKFWFPSNKINNVVNIFLFWYKICSSKELGDTSYTITKLTVMRLFRNIDMEWYMLKQ